jgi:hypothetical protein
MTASLKTEIVAYAERAFALILENREKYLSAWIAETGMTPSECELVEDRSDPLRTVVSVRPRSAPALPVARVTPSCFRCPAPAEYVIESAQRIDACRAHFQDAVMQSKEAPIL